MMVSVAHSPRFRDDALFNQIGVAFARYEQDVGQGGSLNLLRKSPELYEDDPGQSSLVFLSGDISRTSSAVPTGGLRSQSRLYSIPQDLLPVSKARNRWLARVLKIQGDERVRGDSSEVWSLDPRLSCQLIVRSDRILSRDEIYRETPCIGEDAIHLYPDFTRANRLAMTDSKSTGVRVTLLADLTESAKSLCEQVLRGMKNDLASVRKSTNWGLYRSAFENDISTWLKCPDESLEGFEATITSGPLENKSDGGVEVSRHLTYTLGDYTHELRLSIVCNESDKPPPPARRGRPRRGRPTRISETPHTR